MDRKKVRLGMKVTVGSHPEATVFTVAEWIDTWRVRLTYVENDKTYEGGCVDVSTLNLIKKDLRV